MSTSKKKTTKKTDSSKDLKKQIKEMEKQKREEKPVKEDKVVSFDSWYHKRKDSIPAHHKKEVIWADFEARGMKKEATMSEYDVALKKYGIKLDK